MKLTSRQQAALRRAYEGGNISQEKLGNRYGISQTTVQRVLTHYHRCYTANQLLDHAYRVLLQARNAYHECGDDEQAMEVNEVAGRVAKLFTIDG